MSQSLTIAHVVDSLEVGGAEVVVSTLARIQHAEGHRVSVHCLYAEGPLAEELRSAGITVFVHAPGSPSATARRLWRSFRPSRPDVVHCHNAAATIYGGSVARLLSVPVILSTRHSLADRQLFRQELKFWIAARLCCRTVVVVSDAVRRSMEAHPLAVPGKLALIRNGATAAAGERSNPSRSSGFVLVNVARLTALKDHMTLLRAAAIARKVVPDLEVWIVGDGEQGEQLRAFTREEGMTAWVHLAGERNDVGAYLAQADVFVLSSKSEGLPISLLEAMASGLPAISTHVGGIPEVAEMSGACELVPPSDPQSMAEAICRYAANRKQLAELGARARQCYELWFSPERMARDYMKVYLGQESGADTPQKSRPSQAVVRENPRASLYSEAFTRLVLPSRDFVRQRHYARFRSLLTRSQWWSFDEIQDFQWRELRKLLECAFGSVPYYQQKYAQAGARLEDIRTWEDFAKLPPLTRQEVNAFRQELCSTAFRGKLLPHATGGSSGVPTHFYRTYESYDWRTAARDRVYSWAGLIQGERTVYLWGAPVGKVSRQAHRREAASDMLQRRLMLNTFSQDERLWSEVYAKLVSFRPHTVVGYVSSLRAFSAFLQERNLRVPPLRGVIAAAEPLFAHGREQIAAGFGAPVFNTYGSREFMSLAGECERHEGLHINAENVLIETDQPDAPSQIYVTDLHNYGMPFIRYDIGDVGSLVTASCACGRGLPRLRSVDGRILDVLRTPDGRLVPGEFFPHLLKDVPEIREYQVIQRVPDRLEIVAVISGSLSENSRMLLQVEIGKIFGPRVDWELKPVDRIPRLDSGKRRVTVGMN